MFLEVRVEEQDLPFVSPVTVGCVEGQGLVNNVMCETAMTAAVYRCSRESLERDR